jgi:hypothetical protein
MSRCELTCFNGTIVFELLLLFMRLSVVVGAILIAVAVTNRVITLYVSLRFQLTNS